jgi:lactate/malate dehydrogenase, alpha/beta C-terminal domain
VKLNGEHGVKDLYVGVPAVIGAKGVEKIVEVALDPSEKQMFEKSVGSVRDVVEACKTINPILANRIFMGAGAKSVKDYDRGEGWPAAGHSPLGCARRDPEAFPGTRPVCLQNAGQEAASGVAVKIEPSDHRS